MCGRWGWRPLVLSLFFSVFVVACNVIHISPTPGSTATVVPVTLTLRHPRGPTPLPSSLNTAAPAMVAAPDTTSQAPAVAFEGLRCYMVGREQSMCLGSVRNLSGESLQQIAITLQMEGAVPPAQTIWLEQALLPPNDSAPYRVFWQNVPAAGSNITVSLARAERLLSADRFADLRIVSAEGRMHDGRYALSAEVMNDDDADALDVRALLMLRAPDGGVAGYRVAHVSDRLPAGERMRVDIAVIPQQMRDDLRPSLHVEAFRADVGQ